jgi:hypothetical protein
MMSIRRLGALGVAWILLSGTLLSCDEPTGADREIVRELAWLHYLEAHPLEVEVPDSVARDAPFRVTFMTYAGGCITHDFEVETMVQGLEAEIVPYQFRHVPPPGSHCPARSWGNEREVTLRFEQAGQAEILLRGRRLMGGDTTELALTYEVDVVGGQ